MGRAVLRLLLAATLIAAIAGAVYLLVGAPPLAPRATVSAPRPSVTRGFVGIAAFGHWRLICSSEAAETQAPKPHSTNQCRINQEVADPAQKGQVILAVNFTVVGPARRAALMLRLPPTARDGDVILLRADDVGRARITVRGCNAGECVAAGDLTNDNWKGVLAAKALQVSFPALNRQRVIVDVSADGLTDAAHAMAAAQTAPR